MESINGDGNKELIPFAETGNIRLEWSVSPCERQCKWYQTAALEASPLYSLLLLGVNGRMLALLDKDWLDNDNRVATPTF